MSDALPGRSWQKKVDVHFKLTWLNCLWLIVPLLIWNLVYGPKLTDPRITSDTNSPGWLLIAENITRMAVFILPLLIPLQIEQPLGKAGLAIYIIGTLIYFVSWLPLLFAPGSAWSNSPPGLLAPALTPFLCFLGIALIGHSWTYGVLAAAFIAIHASHGIQNL
ncbi:MAG TPA: hypothetical protein VFQ13_04520 [Anaerolineales bacterium]|nr:hypothetical protein [Anaerolineales bacterium]